jgi:hypothetical protein
MKEIFYRVIGIVLGMVYGLFLLAGSFTMSGGGDGSYVYLEVFSSPLSFISLFFEPLRIFMFIGMPFLWGLAGFLATIPDKCKRKKVLTAFMWIHYLGVLLDLSTSPSITHYWNTFFRLYLMLPSLISISIYLLGQVWLWKRLLDTFRKEEAE